MAKNKINDAVKRHKKRSTSSGCRFTVSDRIDHLNLDEWMKIVGNEKLSHSPDYLKVLQAYPPGKVSHRFAMIHGPDSMPMACAVMQILELNARDLVGEDSKPLKKRVLKGLKTKLLVLGNIIGGSNSGIISHTNENLWPAVTELLYRVRRSEKLDGSIDIVMIKDLPKALAASSGELKTYSYRPMDTGPDMVLPFEDNWSSFNDYLGSMNTKYRKSTKKIFSEIEKAGCTVESTSDITPFTEQIYAIYKQVEKNADVRVGSLHPEYLPELGKALGPERFRCSLIRRGKEILGFVTTLKDGDNAIGYYLGVDYEASSGLPIYFRLLAAVIEDAFILGSRQVSFGRTAEEPKARFGAKPVETQAWLKHSVPVVNVIFRQLLQLVSHEEAPVRNTFKKS